MQHESSVVGTEGPGFESDQGLSVWWVHALLVAGGRGAWNGA